MTFLNLDINAPIWTNAEDESRTIFADEKHDIVKDLLGSATRRPGLSLFSENFPGVIDGMYYWEHTDLLYVVSRGDLHSVARDGEKTIIENDLFEIGSRVVWAEVGDTTIVTPGADRKIFATNGGRIVEYDGTTANKLVDTDAPEKSTFIAVIDTYLVSNDLSSASKDESFFYSEAAAPTSWVGEYASAEGKPDRLVALAVAWNELTLFGTETVEPWYDDGATPFVALKAGIVEQGTISPHTIKKIDNAWFFLTTDKRLVRIDGRQPTIISQPIDDILGGITDVSDATAEWVTIGGKTIYLLNVGTRTLAYDYAINEWLGDWTYYNTVSSKYTEFRGRNFINIKQWGKTFCSDILNANLYTVSLDVYQDLGNVIRSSITTGQIDHGTGRLKRSNELRLRLKTGEGDPEEDEPLLLIRWRDNGKMEWGNYREIPLGYKGNDNMYYSIFELGSYRSRQYEFVVSDNVQIALVSAEEDVVLLR